MTARPRSLRCTVVTTFGTLCWRLWRSGRNTMRRFAVEEPGRGCAMAGVVTAVAVLVVALVHGVLLALEHNPSYAFLVETLVDHLLALFFFGLVFLVGLSSTLITWNAIYTTRSAHFQAQLPITDRSLYWGGAVEGGLWSSWAMLVLGIPLLLGLCQRSAEPIAFLGASLLCLLGFLACCMGVGALGAVVLAQVIPVIRRSLRAIAVAVVLAICAVIGALVGDLEPSGNGYDYLDEVFSRIGFIRHPLLPSSWAQRGVSAALRGDWWLCLHQLALLTSTAAMLFLAGEWLAVRRLRRDLDRLTGRDDARRNGRSRRWKLLPLLPADLGLLVAKDIRLFLRDPGQLLQFLLFFGLLGFYIVLLPRIGRAFLDQEWWATTVSLLNLLAVSMALATFTGRFVYPLISQEGRRLWVLVLAPWPPRRVVTAKFVFALLIGVPVASGLVGLSGMMLRLPAATVIYQSLVTVCLGLGLASAALGLGAKLADYEEDNPAKLVAGYGGTVNLLASLIYTGLMLIGAAMPLIVDSHPVLAWTAGIAWTLLLTAVWTGNFLRLAWRHFGVRD